MINKEKIIDLAQNIAALACDPSQVWEGDLDEIVKKAEQIEAIMEEKEIASKSKARKIRDEIIKYLYNIESTDKANHFRKDKGSQKMPIISIPPKAKNKYFNFCKLHNAETSKQIRDKIRLQGNAYIEAVGDICGDSVAGSILLEATLLLQNNKRSICGGMYLDLD